MNENPAEGVGYYRGNIPPDGIYADWVKEGREPSCLSAVVATAVVLTILWLVCQTAVW